MFMEIVLFWAFLKVLSIFLKIYTTPGVVYLESLFYRMENMEQDLTQDHDCHVLLFC